jgi:DNA modification methylase
MTAPYYQDDRVTLFLGDCREVAEWLAADVLVTDPPYGRGALGINNGNQEFGRRGRRTNRDVPIVGDEDAGMRDAALSAWGARPAVVFGDLRIPCPAGTMQIAVYRKPADAGQRSTAGFRRDVEGIFLLRLPAGYSGRSSVIESGASMVSRSHGIAARYGHPHAKPVDVMETLIAACPPGVIADPFAGAGSTLVAARNLGRKAIGVELNERYCKRAAERLAQDVLELARGDLTA